MNDNCLEHGAYPVYKIPIVMKKESENYVQEKIYLEMERICRELQKKLKEKIRTAPIATTWLVSEKNTKSTITIQIEDRTNFPLFLKVYIF